MPVDCAAIDTVATRLAAKHVPLQDLRAAVTTLDRVFQENQTFIVQCNSRSISGPIAGGIKTGYKKLFLVNVRSATSSMLLSFW